jgi:hypothetical protein
LREAFAIHTLVARRAVALREIIYSPVPSCVSASDQTFDDAKTVATQFNTAQTQLKTQLNPNETQWTQLNTAQKVVRRKP